MPEVYTHIIILKPNMFTNILSLEENTIESESIVF